MKNAKNWYKNLTIQIKKNKEIADNLIYDYEIIDKETQLASKFEIRKSETFVKYQNFMRNSYIQKKCESLLESNIHNNQFVNLLRWELVSHILYGKIH